MCGLGGGLPSQRFKGFKVFKGLERFEGLEGLEGLGFKGWQTAGLDAHKKPLMCGLGGGLTSQRFKGFKGFKVFKGFKLFKGLEGLRVGKRQAWTPIRSHGCVALGCLLAAG